MSLLYILDKKGNPIPEKDPILWAKWFGKYPERRFLAKNKIGESLVSTVFLGIDHSCGNTTPLVFETMVFGGKQDGHQDKYRTKKEALEGHEKVIAMVELVEAQK